MLTISEKEFKQLADYVRANYGVNLKIEKMSLVVGRLQGVLSQLGYKNFTEYYNYVVSEPSGEAAKTLINKLTTNHTFFMRETKHFDYFKTHVLPYLVSTQSKSKDLRIWCAGCSSGEEPYTIAMILADYFGSEKMFWDTKVLATDISTNVLETAVQGIYLNEQINSLPAQWQKSYFRKVDSEQSVVVDKIRNEVIFRKFNLMNPFPFRKKFQVIFCRNVMIYFNAQTKRELVNKFYEFTEPGGYLFIGHSESLNREETRYNYVMPAVYRKE